VSAARTGSEETRVTLTRPRSTQPRLVAKQKLRRNEGDAFDLAAGVTGLPLWQLDIVELTGHNIESRGREEVNQLLREGWRLLHIYTLKYEEAGIWRERPMAILGRLRNTTQPPGARQDR
jgi:hypothetical protein